MKKEPIVYLGEAQLLMQEGALPLTFEIKAGALGEATEKGRRRREGCRRARGQGASRDTPRGCLTHHHYSEPPAPGSRRARWPAPERQDPMAVGAPSPP
jgi:hypothetical protein